MHVCKPDPVIFRQKNWVGGVLGREDLPLILPSQHSLTQGGEGGKDAFWILLTAKRVPYKILDFFFLRMIQETKLYIKIKLLRSA